MFHYHLKRAFQAIVSIVNEHSTSKTCIATTNRNNFKRYFDFALFCLFFFQRPSHWCWNSKEKFGCRNLINAKHEKKRKLEAQAFASAVDTGSAYANGVSVQQRLHRPHQGADSCCWLQISAAIDHRPGSKRPDSRHWVDWHDHRSQKINPTKRVFQLQWYWHSTFIFQEKACLTRTFTRGFCKKCWDDMKQRAISVTISF